MIGAHKLSVAVAAVGALVIAAHLVLAVAGMMTPGQWQSGVVIGLVGLVAGGIGVARTR